MDACSNVAPRQLGCGLASDSRTLSATLERRARKSAHHLLAPPLADSAVGVIIFLTRSRRVIASSRDVSLVLMVARATFRETTVSSTRSLAKPFSRRKGAR